MNCKNISNNSYFEFISQKFYSLIAYKNLQNGKMNKEEKNDDEFIPSFQKQILYIRVPSMDTDDLTYYKENILKKAEGQTFNAVVIDIRHNGGGSDMIWGNLISYLSD